MTQESYVIALQKEAAIAAEKARSAYASWKKAENMSMGQSLQPVMNILAVNPKGTLRMTAQLIPLIDSVKKAHDCLALTENLLSKARARTKDYNFFDRHAGLTDASLSSIESILGWIAKVRPQIPKSDPVPEIVKKRVALALAQSAKTFHIIDENAKDQPNYLKEFVDSLSRILGYIISKIINKVVLPTAVNIWPVLLGAGVLGVIGLWVYGAGQGAGRSSVERLAGGKS